MIKDYQIFKETITNLIKKSELDVGIVYFIMKDIFSELEKLYFAQINSEILNEKQNTEIKSEETASE